VDAKNRLYAVEPVPPNKAEIINWMRSGKRLLNIELSNPVNIV
jgi:hypothetical protein